MWFIGTAKMRTDALSQLLGRKQPVGLNDGPFAMHPPGFDGIEPGTLRGQPERQNTHTFRGLFDLLVVFSDPALNALADMPGGIVPDQQPGCFPLGFQTLATPVKELGGDLADRTPSDKAQPHLVPLGRLRGTGLPQHAITGQRFGIRIVLVPGLLHQTHGMILVLPGMQARLRKAAPPDLIEEPVAQVGCWLAQAISLSRAFFFADTADRGW